MNVDNIDKQDIQFMSFTKGGSLYIAYKIKKVVNHVNPKTKKTRDELLILGIPSKHVFRWLADHEIEPDELFNYLRRSEDD